MIGMSLKSVSPDQESKNSSKISVDPEDDVDSDCLNPPVEVEDTDSEAWITGDVGWEYGSEDNPSKVSLSTASVTVSEEVGVVDDDSDLQVVLEVLLDASPPTEL